MLHVTSESIYIKQTKTLYSTYYQITFNNFSRYQVWMIQTPAQRHDVSDLMSLTFYWFALIQNNNKYKISAKTLQRRDCRCLQMSTLASQRF